ncbi:MAG: glycosyltransferase family 39 protein [Planctomycetia bacterium]|nr:glycosyltransferase family 39 protein [Planctomycetia bacterium]
MRWQFHTSPLGLAVLVTLANAAKPVTVDDSAYLIFARHIFAHPLDPYGFSIFWYAQPEPAMEVVCPPVVPYWLALGMRLFGEHIGLLKLWLFPFVWLFTWSLSALLRRFTRGAEHFALPLLVLSPAILPAVNLMLDVPAVALALASVELFIRATTRRDSVSVRASVAGLCEAGLSVKPASQRPATNKLRHFRSNWWLALVAGLVGALAMQTKYTAFVAPAAIAWYGLTHRRIALGAVAVCAAVIAFVAWELLLVAKYDRSHFWVNAMYATSTGGTLLGSVRAKLELAPMLAGPLGCLAVGVGLLALSVLRVSRRWVAGIASVWSIGFVLVCTLPLRWTVIHAPLTAATIFWQFAGVLWVVAVLACARVLVFRVKSGLSVRWNPDTLFLVGWLFIEIGAALALTPFPAARRVIGVTLVMGLIATRATHRIGVLARDRRPPRWLLPLGIAVGVCVAAIDTLDAFPEKWCAEQSANITHTRPPNSTVWYVGHWGFQHYCEQAGMKPLIPKQTIARTGDFLVMPVYPNTEGFHRPYAGFDVVHPPEWAAEVVAEFAWDDWLSAKTVPNFYGGTDPIMGRDHPRLRVRVYRLRSSVISFQQAW